MSKNKKGGGGTAAFVILIVVALLMFFGILNFKAGDMNDFFNLLRAIWEGFFGT